jgi:hypothetical protein
MASAFRVYDLLVEYYGKHLANSNPSTPLSESRARNLSSPVFVFDNNTVMANLRKTAES